MSNDKPDKPEDADATPYLPKRSRKLPALANAAKDCHGCELYLNAEQVVFGEGPPGAALMLVGEQPGDQEDLNGRPFVGPAGKLLRKAIAAAGIGADDFYLTNSVKHFRWQGTRGKRRIHQKPSVIHINACRPWLVAEQEAVQPKVIICLGTTAARALLNRAITIKAEGYKFLPYRPDCDLLILPHPSAMLRIEDSKSREQAYAELVHWLSRAKSHAQSPKWND